jgi:alpha-tubulin suppressor-like RCC1 family protein
MRRVCAGDYTAFAIGENGQLSSWGNGFCWIPGHGTDENCDEPKRVEALLGVRISSVLVGEHHAVALSEDGRVYAWGMNHGRTLLGYPHVAKEVRPTPVAALRAVRLGSVAAADDRSYAVADTGEVWAWGADRDGEFPLGHGEQIDCPLPKPIESLRGVKVDAVAVAGGHTLARADDGSVYSWGQKYAAEGGALGLGLPGAGAGGAARTPQRIPGLRVACGL